MAQTLTDAQMQSLKDYLTQNAATVSGMTDVQVFNYLNTPGLVPNPVTTAPQVPQPYYVADILGLLSTASQANVQGVPYLDRIVDDIDAQDAAGVGDWAQLLLVAGKITQAEAQAIMTRVQATQADPNWTAQIPAGPSPKATLFGSATWTLADGSKANYIPLDDVAIALGR